LDLSLLVSSDNTSSHSAAPASPATTASPNSSVGGEPPVVLTESGLSAFFVSMLSVEAPGKVPSTTSLTRSATSTAYGSPVTFTAAVSGADGTPTGSVTFYDDTTPLGTRDLDALGIATFTTNTLTPGEHAITALYTGDDHYRASAEDPENEVEKA